MLKPSLEMGDESRYQRVWLISEPAGNSKSALAPELWMSEENFVPIPTNGRERHDDLPVVCGSKLGCAKGQEVEYLSNELRRMVVDH